MRLRPAPVLAAVAAVVVSLWGQVPAQGAPESRPAAARALAGALAGAQAALAGETDRDVTLSLRDLRQHRDELSADDRASADRLLIRPTTSTSKCFTLVCVHWSTTGTGKATSAYAAQVASVAEHVLETYAAAGYRAPEADGLRGGNGLLDIYLQDLGGRGLYGYCDSDEPRTTGGARDAWAYCAFDNDYREFPTHTPQQNLEVTAAHELFHAVQFAYDYDEDGWFMEATATWAEDELYDDVDDNIQYLSESPLTQPAKSMDHFQPFGMRQYGDWIFFRYLTETFDARSAGLPTLVRELWERAARDYSISAVAHVLAEHHTSLRAVWAAFADANRRPGTSYDEGAANHYPGAAPAGRLRLTADRPDSGWTTTRVDHLASATYRVVRATDSTARHLRLRLDLPAVGRGSGAVATVYRTSGRPETTPVGLTRRGDASARVAFGRDVRFVEVTLANAGTAYRCWRPADTGFSCRGRSQDDDLPLRMRAIAVR
ncbi:MXAN_6640 family putative metalloprotease [Nocardioides sp.]|uniref:MXAN_6640 family putative metalloprotease n=1 Tax=Nocardioides sp. TaxID=35761 RepID=UPI0025F47DD8|nr:MXAN_6640 family putative metalloprotease [Nocardioides sp.]